MQFGDWEGLTWPEIVARHPEFDLGNETRPRTYTPAGGESFDELVIRIGRALEGIVERTPPDGTALVATHAGPLHALLRLLVTPAGADPLDVRFVPASLTRFRGTPGAAWQLVEMNVTPRPEVAVPPS